MHNRQLFFQRQNAILQMAQNLLLDSADGDLTLDDLASSLEIAKGTLYKHFSSKDELYLHLLINHEQELLMHTKSDESASAILARMVLLSLLNPRKTMLYHWLEERLSAHSVGQKRLFDDLYKVRRERMAYLSATVKTYLDELDSPMTENEYLSSLWAIGQGGASLLNSSFYQRYLGSREQKIWAWLEQALALPKLRSEQGVDVVTAMTMTNERDELDALSADSPLPQKHKKMGIYQDEFSPFGKLMPPSL